MRNERMRKKYGIERSVGGEMSADTRMKGESGEMASLRWREAAYKAN